MLQDWLRKLAPLFRLVKSETKTKRDSSLTHSHTFSRALREVYMNFVRVLIGSLDLYLSSFVIG